MEVKPFRAFRFDPAVVGDVGDCIAPPYDVIGAEQQEQLYEKNEHNIVRITRAKSFACDSDADNQYTRARGYLNEWIASGALKQDSAEAIYGYVQDYDLGGTHLQRLTFIALAKLEDFGKIVKPHEETLEKPMQDRLNLTRATSAQFGLVFMLYNDERGIADEIIECAAVGEALIDFADEQEVRHRLFAIIARKDVEAIGRMMGDKSVIIADGHHRYTTGLMYSRENSNPAAKYQMLAFTNMAHEGLIVLATHRLVANLDGFDIKKLIAGFGRNFKVTARAFDDEESKADAKGEMLARMKREMDKGRNAFAIYGGDGAFYLAVLKDGGAMDSAVPERSAAYRSLDVAVLHKLILEKLLGIDEQRRAKGENLEYVKGTPNAIDDSIARVDAGEKQAAFFVNPIKMSQLIGVTDAGERMPQKSTYFYPKMFTGLTINRL
ncbi:MAG TPA: DUF1015 domain-containing protein [Sedimentisphaerales bacterium]|nr:DUF1015 domain-containing protein [Sedimentisphaerales bacterium]